MATRFYLPASGAAPVTPALGSQWTVTTGWSAHPAPTVKSNTALANGTARQNGSTTSVTDRLDRVFVSAQLDAQTISGTFSAVVQGLESATGHNAWLDIVIRVVSADGQTQRGVLYAGSTATSPSATAGVENQEFGTTLASRIKSAVALSSVAAQAGDRLVIEVGYRKQSTTSTQTATLRYGDPTGSTDAALTAGTTTTTIAPWVELSQTLVFQGGGTSGRAASISSGDTAFRLTGANVPPLGHTMCSFIYLETVRASYSTIYEPSQGQGMFIQNSTDGSGVTLGIHQNGSGGNGTGTEATPVQGQWWKFCMVIGNTVRRRAAPIGSPLAEARTDGLVSYTADTVGFGYSPAWGGEFFIGRMAALKIWTAELSLVEADAEFSQYRAVRTADLWGEWTQFDGPSLVDSSGAGRNLQLVTTTPADASGPPGIPLSSAPPVSAVTNRHFHVLA